MIPIPVGTLRPNDFTGEIEVYTGTKWVPIGGKVTIEVQKGDGSGGTHRKETPTEAYDRAMKGVGK